MLTTVTSPLGRIPRNRGVSLQILQTPPISSIFISEISWRGDSEGGMQRRFCRRDHPSARSIEFTTRYCNRGNARLVASAEIAIAAMGSVATGKRLLKAQDQDNRLIVLMAHVIGPSICRLAPPRLTRSRSLPFSDGRSAGFPTQNDPLASLRSRPSPVRVWINSRSNSARPPKTVSIKRPCAVVVSAKYLAAI